MPLMKTPDHYHLSPLIGAPTRARTWLAFHRGRVRRRCCCAMMLCLCPRFLYLPSLPAVFWPPVCPLALTGHLSPLAARPSAQVQMDNPPYSRGIRQRLATAAKEQGWLEKHKIVVGE